MYLFGIFVSAQNRNVDSSEYPSNILLIFTFEKELKYFNFDIEELKVTMMNQSAKGVLLDQFPIMCLRSFIKEIYEATKAYANETGQFHKFQSRL